MIPFATEKFRISIGVSCRIRTSNRISRDSWKIMMSLDAPPSLEMTGCLLSPR
jgi:hypothetical protein